MQRLSTMAALLVTLVGLAAPRLCHGQSTTAAEREALVRLRVDRGGQAGEVDSLLRQAEEAAAKGLPLGPLMNKIREGLAKGADPERIEGVVRQTASHLETADRLVRETEPNSTGPAREASVTLLAESIGGGTTPEEVRELRRRAQTSGKPMSAVSEASAAKGLSYIKAAQLPASDGIAVIAEAVRQDFPDHEILGLGREVKRRESDYRSGRASLQALRDAIARGDRPAQLFGGSRPTPVERPPAVRPEPPGTRPTRPTRPEPPQRPVRPEPPPAGRGR